MTTATISEGKTKATELVEITQAGETVIVTTDWKGSPAESASLGGAPQRLGFLEHLNLDIPDSFFFDPLPEEELRLWEGRDDDNQA